MASRTFVAGVAQVPFVEPGKRETYDIVRAKAMARALAGVALRGARGMPMHDGV